MNIPKFLLSADKVTHSKGDLVDGFVAGSGRWGVDVVGFDDQPIRIDPWCVRTTFYLGQPVRVRLHKPRHNGFWSGSIVESTLPALTHSDNRPLALLDEANISGFLESPNIPRWTFGATKAWALALALDLAGWHPVFCQIHTIVSAIYDIPHQQEHSIFHLATRAGCDSQRATGARHLVKTTPTARHSRCCGRRMSAGDARF